MHVATVETHGPRSKSGFSLLLGSGLLVILAGCAFPGNAGGSATSGYDNLQLVLKADRSSVAVGESVFIRFSVENKGSDTVVLDSVNTPVLDIQINRAGDADHPMAKWSAQDPSRAAHHLEWKPGESKVLEMTWTAQQSDFDHALSLNGLLSEKSTVVQGASVQICVGHPVCYSP